MDTQPQPYVRYLGGTLVLEGVDEHSPPPAPFRWLNGRWRCPAVHYRELRLWLRQHGVGNRIPRWQKLALTLNDDRIPHDYQLEALQAWGEAGYWGSVVLPTGAGKTLVALRAITTTGVSTLVVVPTIDLLHQWYACLTSAFNRPIGVWYGLEKTAEAITITTYPSAWSHAEELGNQFKLLIFDEIHHLPAPSWHEIALLCAAPYRLGLTATYPDTAADGPDRVALLQELVGPIVYRKWLEELTGEQLAEYRTVRVRVALTAAEQAAYDAAYAAYTGYVRETRLRERYGPDWWHEFTRRSARDIAARQAKLAELEAREIIHGAQAKLELTDRLLRQHRDQPMLIFTAHNRLAYDIARRHLIPPITHQTKAAERKAILDGFRAGQYRALVTTRVLNEGIDVPEAKVAVILGGSAGAQEYMQRLGRVLRKKGNTEAVLYEVIVRNTLDEGAASRRRAAVKRQLGGGK